MGLITLSSNNLYRWCFKNEKRELDLEILKKNFFQVIKLYFNIILKKPFLYAVAIRLTDRCNLRCSYCKSPELNREFDFLKLIDRLNIIHQKGVRHIILSGGEPYMFKSYYKLLNWLRQKKFYIAINTNGRAASNGEYLESLTMVDEVVISIDGPKDVNDKIRGKNSFDSVINTIQFCESRNIKTILSMVLTKYNCNEQTIDFVVELKKKYKIFIDFGIVSERGGISDKDYSRSNKPSKEQLQIFFGYMKSAECKKYFKEVNKKTIDYMMKQTPLHCESVNYVQYIDVTGNVYPCVYMTDVEHAKVDEVGAKAKRKDYKKIACPGCDCNPLYTLNMLIKRPFSLSSIWDYLGIRVE